MYYYSFTVNCFLMFFTFILYISCFFSRGYRVVLSSYPVIQNVSNSTLVNYIRRMVRWLRLRLNMLPLVSGVLEPLCESITLGLLFALTMHYLFDIQIIYLIMMHFTLWILLDYTLLRCIQVSDEDFLKTRFLARILRFN